METIYCPANDPQVAGVLAQYDLPETLLGAVRYGQGHINDTFRVGVVYILQRYLLRCLPEQGGRCPALYSSGTEPGSISPSRRTDGELHRHYLLPAAQGSGAGR